MQNIYRFLLVALIFLILASELRSQQSTGLSARLEKECLNAIQAHHYLDAAEIGERLIASIDSPGVKLATAYYLTGLSYFGATRLADAEEHFRSAIEIGENADSGADAILYLARMQLVETLLQTGSIGELQDILEKVNDYISEHEVVGASILVPYAWARFFWLSNDPRSALNQIDKLTPYLEEARSRNITTYVAIRCLDANLRLALGKTDVKERVLALMAEILALDEKRQARAVAVTLDLIRLLRAVRDDENAARLLRWGLDRIPKPPKGEPNWVYATLKQEEATQLYFANKLFASEGSIREAIESTTSENNPIGRANMYEVLGAIQFKTNRAREALSSFQDAVALADKMPNPALNDLAGLKLQEAICLYFLGEKKDALDLAEQSVDAEDQIYDTVAGNLALTDAQNSIAFLHNFSAADLILDSGDSLKIAKLVLRRKGRIFSNAFTQYNSGDVAGLRDVQNTQEDLSFALQALSMEHDPLKKREGSAQVWKLIDTLESRGARAPSRLKNARIRLQDLLAALPEHKALIDFISFPKLTKQTNGGENKGRGPEMLGAVVYTRGEDPQWIVLGQGDEISSDMKQWDETIYRYPRETAIVDALKKLYTTLWKPLATKIPTDVDGLILCTDYPINYLPFACLIDKDGHFLCESYSIRFVQNVSEAVQAKPVRYSPSDGFLGVFESEFSGDGAKALGLANLNASQQEADAISSFFDQSKYPLLKGKDAREDRVQSLMQRREIIHISTHSIYLPQIARKHEGESSGVDAGLSKNAAAGFAQMAFGTALLFDNGATTANLRLHGTRTDNGDDGFFSLAEISGLNLRRAKLVVLSSCETALAVQLAGEGTLGYERALHAAGAKNVILTLWKIPDDYIPLFFASYYKDLQSTKSFFEAFVEAQRQTLRSLRGKTAKDAITTVGSLVFSSNSLAD